MTEHQRTYTIADVRAAFVDGAVWMGYPVDEPERKVNMEWVTAHAIARYPDPKPGAPIDGG